MSKSVGFNKEEAMKKWGIRRTQMYDLLKNKQVKLRFYKRLPHIEVNLGQGVKQRTFQNSGIDKILDKKAQTSKTRSLQTTIPVASGWQKVL